MENFKKYLINGKYTCEKCNFSHINKNNFVNHLSSKKHLNDNYIKNNDDYICLCCNKIYKTSSGLIKHINKNKNNNNNNNNNNKNNIIKEDVDLLKTNNNEGLIIELIKKIDEKDKKLEEKNNKLEQQNQELLQLIKELSIQKSNIHIETNNSNNNNNNKTLNYNNINTYLNDKCQDALNVEDFIPMIQINLNDLLNVSKMSRNKAVKTLLEKNLKLLEFHKQPFKCSDIKRKKIYAKTDGKWIQDNDYKQTNKVFRHINMESNMLSETPETKSVLNNMDMSSYELRKPLSYGLDDDEINKNTDNEKKIMSEIVYYKNEDEN